MKNYRIFLKNQIALFGLILFSFYLFPQDNIDEVIRKNPEFVPIKSALENTASKMATAQKSYSDGMVLALTNLKDVVTLDPEEGEKLPDKLTSLTLNFTKRFSSLLFNKAISSTVKKYPAARIACEIFTIGYELKKESATFDKQMKEVHIENNIVKIIGSLKDNVFKVTDEEDFYPYLVKELKAKPMASRMAFLSEIKDAAVEIKNNFNDTNYRNFVAIETLIDALYSSEILCVYAEVDARSTSIDDIDSWTNYTRLTFPVNLVQNESKVRFFLGPYPGVGEKGKPFYKNLMNKFNEIATASSQYSVWILDIPLIVRVLCRVDRKCIDEPFPYGEFFIILDEPYDGNREKLTASNSNQHRMKVRIFGGESIFSAWSDGRWLPNRNAKFQDCDFFITDPEIIETSNWVVDIMQFPIQLVQRKFSL